MVKATLGLPLTYAKLEGDSDSDIITLYYWNPATATWEPVIRFKGSTKEIQEIGNIVKSIAIKTASPYIQLQGTETGARTFQIKEDAGKFKVTTGTIDELVVDPSTSVVSTPRDIIISKTTPAVRLKGVETGGKEIHVRENAGKTEIYDASTGAVVMTLESHASRHNRGGADELDYSSIMSLHLASASPTLGVSSTLGSAVSITPSTGYSRLVPQGVKITVGGTLATGETITVRVTFVFSDGTSLYVDKTYTATGDNYLSDADYFTLWKDSVGVTRIDVQAASSATSTTATVTVTVRGIQY